jgi:acetyl esterase/lipase
MSDPDLSNVLPLPSAPDAIELRHLRAFVAVAEELSFSRAAERLFLSQPALSRQISTLERLLGCDLFVRTTRQVELTLSGSALLPRAHRLLTDVDQAVSATREVAGALDHRAARLWQPVAATSARARLDDLQPLRDECERLLGEFAVPPDVETRPANAGGVPALLLEPPSQPRPNRMILYLHGGCYIMGSAFGYRPLAGALAVAAEAAVLLPDYRLAPEHPFPAALEDAVSAFEWLVSQGTAPDRITLAGDSAGAGLAMSVLLHLRATGAPLPGSVALLSPWLDLTCARVGDHQLLVPFSIDRLRSFAGAYAGEHLDHPVLCPLDADLRGLPPILTQAGTGDALSIDALRLGGLAEEQHADVVLEEYDADAHDFQVFWSFLPEAATALARAGEFIRARSDR